MCPLCAAATPGRNNTDPTKRVGCLCQAHTANRHGRTDRRRTDGRQATGRLGNRATRAGFAFIYVGALEKNQAGLLFVQNHPLRHDVEDLCISLWFNLFWCIKYNRCDCARFASAFAAQVHSLCASVTAVYLSFFVFGRVLTRLD